MKDCAKQLRKQDRQATINVESEVKNETRKDITVALVVDITDASGTKTAQFKGGSITVKAGETAIVSAQKRLSDLHFWSWGYGYLYNVTTRLMTDKGVK